ncbi:MAG: hypothetical protein IJL76_03475 [Bacilli bacterium]|nr:hypothetical protein [Bacilli bacterium]
MNNKELEKFKYKIVLISSIIAFILAAIVIVLSSRIGKDFYLCGFNFFHDYKFDLVYVFMFWGASFASLSILYIASYDLKRIAISLIPLVIFLLCNCFLIIIIGSKFIYIPIIISIYSIVMIFVEIYLFQKK